MIPIWAIGLWQTFGPRIISYGIVAGFAAFSWWQISSHYEAKGAAEAVRACNTEKRIAAETHRQQMANLSKELDGLRATAADKASADETKIAELTAALKKKPNNGGKGGWSKDTAKRLGF